MDEGWVDYALLPEGGGPLVFIEAKGLGRVDIAGEEQLFRYAVNKGVPFLILTDGDLWDFSISAWLPVTLPSDGSTGRS